MTIDEWESADEANALLSALRDAPARKLRLLGVACCRRVVRLMPNRNVRTALTTAEKFADGATTPAALDRAQSRAWEAADGPFPDDERSDGGAYALAAKAVAASCAPDLVDAAWVLENAYGASVCDPDDPEEEDIHHVKLIRDIFGNPFAPVAFAPEWRTSNAVALAATMYDGRDFTPMPVLADALEDAGCANADVLAHCRDPIGVHVRGCWVVDGLLGKA